MRSNRASGIPQIGWQGNDIIDADFVEIPSGHIRQADNSLLQDSTQLPSPIHAKAAGRKNTPPPPNSRLPTAQGEQPKIPKHKAAKKPESGQDFPAPNSGFLICYETIKPRYETHAGHDKTVTKPCYETKILL